MRFAYFAVIMLILIVNVTARSFNAKDVPHLKMMERLISGEDEMDLRNDLILRDFLQNHPGKRGQGGFTVVLKIFNSAIHDFAKLEIPVSLDDSNTCLKQSSTRGLGSLHFGACPDGEERSGVLCYPTCSDDYHGDGPFCWQNCPTSAPHNCGVLCTESVLSCFEKKLSIAKSVLEMGFTTVAGIEDPLTLIETAFEGANIVQSVISNPYCS